MKLIVLLHIRSIWHPAWLGKLGVNRNFKKIFGRDLCKKTAWKRNFNPPLGGPIQYLQFFHYVFSYLIKDKIIILNPYQGHLKGNLSPDHDDRAINFCSIKCHFVRSKFWPTNTFIQIITVTFSEYKCRYKKSRVLYLKINNVALRLRSKTMPIPTKNRIKSEKVSLSFLPQKS